MLPEQRQDILYTPYFEFFGSKKRAEKNRKALDAAKQAIQMHKEVLSKFKVVIKELCKILSKIYIVDGVEYDVLFDDTEYDFTGHVFVPYVFNREVTQMISNYNGKELGCLVTFSILPKTDDWNVTDEILSYIDVAMDILDKKFSGYTKFFSCIESDMGQQFLYYATDFKSIYQYCLNKLG